MTPPPDGVTITVRRQLRAAPETVFDAWLDPATAGEWLFATPGGKMVVVDIDARVGGRYTITGQRGDALAEHSGTYLSLDRPRHLAFSFGGAREVSGGVAVLLSPNPEGCELTLTHRGAPADLEALVTAGWAGILEGLARRLDVAQ